MPSPWQLCPEEEKAQYDLHQNDPADSGYRQFLSRLADPLMARLKPGSVGLDFGCGPGPTLSVMMAEVGFPMDLYDIYYFPDVSWQSRRYDFITATEVLEHLAAPLVVLKQLWQRLPSGGWLALMTKRWTTLEAFSRWHYILDPTHVSFFHQVSFEWLAQQLGAKLEIVGPDVVLLGK